MPDDAGVKVVRPGEVKPGQHWLDVTQLGSGWAAVEMWLNNEDADHFQETYQTGIGRYATMEEAVTEMMRWAESDDLPIMWRAP